MARLAISSLMFTLIISILTSCGIFTGRPDDKTPGETSFDEDPIPTGEFTLLRDGEQWAKKDNNSEKFNYNGTWEVINGQGYLDSMHFTNTPKSRVMIPYSGPRARIYGKKGPNMGTITIYIDLKEEGRVDLYNSEEISDVLLFDTGWIDSGAHIMMIRLEDEKNDKSKGTGFYFDYLENYDVMDESYFVEVKQNLTGKMVARTFETKIN